jgi:hypothetical protein
MYGMLRLLHAADQTYHPTIRPKIRRPKSVSGVVNEGIQRPALVPIQLGSLLSIETTLTNL